MKKEDRIKLIHALMAASNAFHKMLKEYGYYVSYGLDDSNIGCIKKIDTTEYERQSLGWLKIMWRIKE